MENFPGEGLEHQAAHQGEQGGGGKLYRSKQVNILVSGKLIDRHNVQGIK